MAGSAIEFESEPISLRSTASAEGASTESYNPRPPPTRFRRAPAPCTSSSRTTAS
jgi:hypothetical protein